MITRDEARRLWIEALRSGKYKQGRHVLHNRIDNTYCCLGVACELFKDELDLRVSIGYDHAIYVTNEITNEIDDYSCDMTVFNGAFGTVPKALGNLLGLISDDGRSVTDTSGGSECFDDSLIFHNDHHRKTFEQIADLLETGNYWMENKK